MSKVHKKIQCLGCGNIHGLHINPDIVDPDKVKITSCHHCPVAIREAEFKKISLRHMKPKKIMIGNFEATIEMKPPRLKRYSFK